MFKNLPRQTLLHILKLLGFFLSLSLLIQLLVPVLTSESAREFIVTAGLFGPLLLVLFFVLSHILAPVIGSPGVLLGFALFGIVQTFVLLYIAGLLSAVINFWIARRFGREWVVRLLGKESAHLDRFVALTGRKMLILCRIFGYPFFEIISYAAGLTNMNFKTYYTITVLFAAIPTVVSIALFLYVGVGSVWGTLIWVGGLVIVGGVFGYFIRRYARKN